MLGKFHEISIATADIRASVEFYEGLGFTHATTTDTWPHPYGVLTDGRLFIGLHQRRAPSPALTFVRPAVAGYASMLTEQGVHLTQVHTGDDVFNKIGFSDPFGQPVTLIEARTYSPVVTAPDEVSLCGYFDAYSMPAADFQAARAFWEPMGFVATDESDSPYVHLALISDLLNIAFHRPRTLDTPAIVFRDSAMATRIARLRELGVHTAAELPRGIDASHNALLQSPEGTHLLLLQEES